MLNKVINIGSKVMLADTRGHANFIEAAEVCDMRFVMNNAYPAGKCEVAVVNGQPNNVSKRWYNADTLLVVEE